MKTTEQILRGFGLKAGMFNSNVFDWFVKGGVSVVVVDGNEVAKVELSITTSPDRLSRDMLPIMAAATLLNAVANGVKGLDVDTLAAMYVGQEWFPKAAEDYAADHWDQFVAEETGTVCFSEDSLFEKVMRNVFWPLCDTELADPDSFENKVWEAIPDGAFTDAERAVREAAADGRENRTSCAYNGVRQSDFL